MLATTEVRCVMPDDKERTAAALTLIKDDTLGPGREHLVEYTIVLSFLESRYLPPFLPFYKEEVPIAQRSSILEPIDSLQREFDKYESGYDAYLQNKKQIWERIVGIGGQIAGMCNFFSSILKVLHQLDVRDLVIFTNDGEIPWHWLYNRARHPFQFLCECFSVGIVFLQLEEWGYTSLGEKLQGGRLPVPGDPGTVLEDSKGLIMYDPHVPLATKEAEDLQRLFSDKRIEPSGISVSERSFEELNKWFLKAANASTVKIIHYAGHNPAETGLDSNWLKGLGHTFAWRPLVFLNGCFSGKLATTWNLGSSLATEFLNKGACGCVVTNMPVSDPAAHKVALEFYRQVLDYDGDLANGEALRRARTKLDESDPMRLFFTLYGDPRAKLAYEKSKGEEISERMAAMPQVTPFE